MNTGLKTGRRQGFIPDNLIREGNIDWTELGSLDWAIAMQECPQEPEYHAEGDVWTHTRMVVDALIQLREYQALESYERQLLLHAALLHDVAKPVCTVIENGRVSSPRHAKVGEKIAREILWDFDFEFREKVCALVRHHGLPIWGLEKNDPVRSAILAGWRVRNELTYILCKADIIGRISPTKDDFFYRLELYRELCLENDCFYREREWYNEYSRFRYYWSDESYPTEIFDDTTFEIIILCGIAGSGKDTLYRKQYAHLPLVSLDDIRQELRVKPDDKNGQGRVVQLAYERAKEYCRNRRSFVWNSTNLSADMRSKLVGTLRVYNPRFIFVYVETSQSAIFERRRADIKSAVLERMIQQLEVPQAGEGHQVLYVV